MPPLLRCSLPAAPRPPHTLTLPLPRRTFTHHPSRPRLPPLLRRPSLLPPPPQTPHSPPRRLISAQTRAYLIRESLIAARIVTYGYSLLFVGGLLATTAVLVATEQSHPTPPTLPWRTRTALTLSRAIAAWTGHRPAATIVLRSALEELELAPQRTTAWRLAHQQTLGQLAEFAELAEDPSAARELWQRLVDTPTATGAARVAAGLRVAKIAEFQRDDAAAEAALLAAVAAGEKAGGKALVTALTETAVFRASRGDQFAALELLTRVLATRRAAGRPVDPGSAEAAEMVADPCAEAATMTYIGEILFALGERREGVAWSKKAFSQSAGLAELRGKCKECAIVAGTNLSAMAALMEAEEQAGEKRSRRGRFSGFFAKTEPEPEPAESADKWDGAVRQLEQIRASKNP